jgi:hypothetical protein
MHFNLWKKEERRPYHEKGWRRQDLATWDAKWHRLAAGARLAYLAEIKTGKPGARMRASVNPDQFPPPHLKALTEAGFVEVRQEGRGEPRVFAVDDALEFTNRVRNLRRFHLLAENQPSELQRYLNHCFYQHPLMGVVHGVLRKAGIAEYCNFKEAIERYLTNYRWPQWVLADLRSPLAGRMVAVVQETDQPVPLAELADRFPDHMPAEVRTVLDDLVTHLVLFEDLHPQTKDLVVGLLPAVRQGLARASQPRQRPPLQACERLRETAPEAGPLVNDLRVFLLEVAGEPPRLRQDESLYQREWDRFLDGFEPLPAWLTTLLRWSPERRLEHTLAWARAFRLVESLVEDGQARLHLSAQGRQWLAATLEGQYARLYRTLRTMIESKDSYQTYYAGDADFLGCNVTAVPTKKGQAVQYWQVKPEQRQPLRDAFFRAFAELPMGVFHRLDRFLAHATFAQHNPLLLGNPPDRVAVIFYQRQIPPLPEQLEETGRRCLEMLIQERLVPLGCLRVGMDQDNQVCIARLPRLDEYFGQEASHADLVEQAGAEPRVIVQPDFSVIIIGLNPTPAAELAPFCERVKGHAGQGSLVLKITRESVVKAVIHGMDATEIMGRLQRHASNDLPANVLHELRDWCAWVRRVTSEVVTVLRCPDRETADRTVSALGRLAERLNETMVAVRQTHLTGAERNKLQRQGIIVQKETDSGRR